MAPLKILVVGDINGQVETLFQKLSALHAKSPFALAIIVGELFGDPKLLTGLNSEAVSRLIAGDITVPLPTYFSIGSYTFPQNVIDKLEAAEDELCPNLYFLGRCASTRTSDGLTIATFGGHLIGDGADEERENKYSQYYQESDLEYFLGNRKADILITANWPDSITKGSAVEFNAEKRPTSQPLISSLCSSLKPRYHFSTSGDWFYEREPFFHPHQGDSSSEAFQITRFISLASLNNPNKQKWIYAFSLDPDTTPPISLPKSCTTTPLNSSQSRKNVAPGDPSARFSTASAVSRNSNPRKRQRRAPRPGPAECFFCLSNPNISTHLITSIGNESYMTTAKGPLTTADNFEQINTHCHMLIIPIAHSPTLAQIPDTESRESTQKEMELFRQALHTMLKRKAPDLCSVTWEVRRSEGIHAHWQFLPVPGLLLGEIEKTARAEAVKDGYPSFESASTAIQEEAYDCFQMVIWESSTGKETALTLPFDGSFRFDLQFGRRVMALVLGLQQRLHWQDCIQSTEEEEKDVAQFKEMFRDFDFTCE